MPSEITTTQDVPIWHPKPKKKKKKDPDMNEALFAVEFMTEFDLESEDVLNSLLEADIDKAAKKMAAKVKDPEKRAAAEKKFKANMEKFAKKKKED